MKQRENLNSATEWRCDKIDSTSDKLRVLLIVISNGQKLVNIETVHQMDIK